MLTSDVMHLLAAIRLKPDEDTPRLMLADELQQCGFDGAAKFIREDIAYQEKGARKLAGIPRRRQMAALNYIHWLKELFGLSGDEEFIIGAAGWNHIMWKGRERRTCQFKIARGLPWHLRTTAPMLMERAKWQFLFPLTACEVTDRKPQREDFGGISWHWSTVYWPQRFNTWEESENVHEIPPALYDLLPTPAGWKRSPHRYYNRGSYPSTKSAMDDLNAAAFAFGQSTVA